GDRRQLSRLLAALGVPRELPLHRVDQYPGHGDPGRDGQPARGRGRSRAVGVDPRDVPRLAALPAARLRAHADGADGLPAPGVAELRAPQPRGARAGGRRGGVTGGPGGLWPPRSEVAEQLSLRSAVGLQPSPGRWRRRDRRGRARGQRRGWRRWRRWSGRRWGCRHRWQRRDPDPVIGNGDAVTLQLIVAAGVLHDSDGWRREEHHTPIDPPPEVERRPGPGPVLKAPALPMLEAPR